MKKNNLVIFVGILFFTMACGLIDEIKNIDVNSQPSYNPFATVTPQGYSGNEVTQPGVEVFPTQTPILSYQGYSCDYFTSDYEKTGITREQYDVIIEDGTVDKEEIDFLYNNYYKESPPVLYGHGTFYGKDLSAISELNAYRDYILQQMDRGWVLVGSGMYGNHKYLSEDLKRFIESNYPYLDDTDTLLSNQSSPLYYFFADGGIDLKNRDSSNQPIIVSYDRLNENQKRVYNITTGRPEQNQELYYSRIDEQTNLSEQEALSSGKYIGVISTKSPNDFGKRFLVYDCVDGTIDFVGVVIVGGMAKRDDWIGIGSPTTDYFSLTKNPLITRFQNDSQWAFDLSESMYKYFGGDGGPTRPIIMVNPDILIKH